MKTFIFVAVAGLVPPAVGVLGLVYAVLIGSKSGILSSATEKDLSGFLSWSIAIIDEIPIPAASLTIGTKLLKMAISLILSSQLSIPLTSTTTLALIHGNYNERIEGNYVQGNYYAAQRQSLAEAAAEIQTLLEQLDKSYPTNTTAGKMAIATQAIEYIDSDQTLAQRVLSALKAGGTQALAQFLNHPAASFVIGALDDWQKSKKS